MNPKMFAALAVSCLALNSGQAFAGKTIEESGTITCVMDKWDETEREKGHKIAKSANRCILIPDDRSAPKVTEDCKGTYEYLPDGSWNASGTCTDTYQGGGTTTITWEEGSHLKEYTFTKTGGTGPYAGASGGGTYFYETLTDTLVGGWFKGKMVLP